MRFGLFPVRSPLLGESLLFSCPAGTKMFQFPALASRTRRDVAPSGRRVVPFGHLRIKGHLRLPAAFRSLSRPSSPPRAKASAMRPFLLFLEFTLVLSSIRLPYVAQPWKACAPLVSQHVIDRAGMKPEVENNGFEPLTPCLQSRCSSQLS